MGHRTEADLMGDFASIVAELQMPSDLVAEIERARAHVEGEMNGRVVITVSWQSFSTWWATRHTGRPTTDIELTPTIMVGTDENVICNALVQRGMDGQGGAFWLHPDAIKRMVRWLHEPRMDDDFNEAHSPFSDEETAERRAKWQADQDHFAAMRSQASA